ncbi:MAG TPA: Spy/CpxP family protein refolding chaperone [Pyrinomonadaceae bacterium]|nr:Spy/CpxP family protein refolding chaperone [Pyrinomonadaceae bacterium]
MRQTICLLIFSLALGVAASAQEMKHGGYAGEEGRAIKSLSAEEVEQLLNGHGMGLAKAAELNHYPGPRHVLELGEQLQLTPAQRASAQAAFERMRDEAVRLGRQIVERERELDAMFARADIDAGRLRATTNGIAVLQGELRAAHLAAHLEMRRLLSPVQIKRYDELRGYSGGAAKQTSTQPAAHGNHKH